MRSNRLYKTTHSSYLFQAVNCPASIYQPLRDENPHPDSLLLTEVLEAVPQKFVLIVAHYCLLPAQTAEFKLSEEHKEVRLFSISQLSQIPIPDVYVKAVKLTQRALT